jgi:hypothetical protein
MLGLFLLTGLTLAAFDPVEMNEITFVNALSGGRSIEFIFVTPNGSNLGGVEILKKTGRSINPSGIGPGAELSCYFYYPGDSAGFDVLAIDDKGDAYVIRNVRIKDGNEAVVSVVEQSKNTKIKDGFLLDWLEIVNKTGEELYYLFFAPVHSEMWGIELLNRETTLRAGDLLGLTIMRNIQTGFSCDIIAFDKNGNQFLKRVTLRADENAKEVIITKWDTVK